MKLILLGYMGSGKSTIGKALSTDLNLPFIDLDDYIEKKEGKRIKDIFSLHGEIYFRKTERACLEELMNEKANFVLALGGGTPCYYNNMEYINSFSLSKTIYLKTNLSQLVTRLSKEKDKRPIISGIETDELLKEFIAKHVFERSFFYNKAKYTFENNDLNLTLQKIKLVLG